MNSKARHQKIVAKIFIVLGSLAVAFGIVALNAFPLIADCWFMDHSESISIGFFSINRPYELLLVIPYFYLTFAVLKIIIGVGLLRGYYWSKLLALILGIFYFFDFPLGTAFSIYIFYSLMDDDIARRFGFGSSSEAA